MEGMYAFRSVLYLLGTLLGCPSGIEAEMSR